jgi:hypothetical protein
MRPQARPAKSKIRMLIEQLEPRVLYSADAGSLLSTEAVTPLAEIRIAEESAPNTSPTAEISTTRHEVVFVDTRVSDYQTLVDDILNQQNASKTIEVILLDPAHDGVQSMLDALQDKQNISAIHWIGEGTGHRCTWAAV